MVQSDPIADFLTRVRNGIMAQHRYVDVKRSRMISNMLEVMKRRGYIESFKLVEQGPKPLIRVYLKYRKDRTSAIQGLKRISKPGLRQYVGSREVPRVLRGMGDAILTTPQGIMTGKEARQKKCGGEVLCFVW